MVQHRSTQNFFYVPHLQQDKKKHLSPFLYRAQTFPSFLFYLQEYLCYRQHIYFKDYIEYFVTCPNSNKVKNDFFNQSKKRHNSRKEIINKNPDLDFLSNLSFNFIILMLSLEFQMENRKCELISFYNLTSCFFLFFSCFFYVFFCFFYV